MQSSQTALWYSNTYREAVAMLMERNGHHPVGAVERFLQKARPNSIILVFWQKQ